MTLTLDNNRTDTGLFKVSQSKIKQWRTCRRQFFYAHVMKLQRRKVSRPLVFGSIVHKMKEEQAHGGDPYSVLDEIPQQDLDAYENDPEQYGDLVNDIKFIYEAYEDFWGGKELKYLAHGDRTAEFPFEVELDRLQIKGTIDAVTRHNKMNWLTEHKNHARIPNDDERWRSVQSVVYIKVIQTLGWWKNIEGTCWDYIRTKAPTRPQVLKDGGISVRKIDTLPNVVRQTLKKYEYRKLPNYKSLVDAATLNMSTYFQRVYTPIKMELVEQVWGDFLTTAKEMRDIDITKPPVRTIGLHCGRCQFESLCRASLTGGDEDFLIEHDYVPSTYGERNVEENND
jgi:hypothetical protein